MCFMFACLLFLVGQLSVNLVMDLLTTLNLNETIKVFEIETGRVSTLDKQICWLVLCFSSSFFLQNRISTRIAPSCAMTWV
jgi:hypothetical protein